MAVPRFRRHICGPPLGCGRRPWREVEYCVVDLETTGLDLGRDTIVSYGAVVIAQGSVHTSTARYGLVAPESALRDESIPIHELRRCDLARAPSLDEALDVLVPLLEGRVLVAHAAWIERAFLGRALRRRRLRLTGPSVDTAALARAAHVVGHLGGHEPALEPLAVRLGLEPHAPHHALGDALTTAELFLLLAHRLEREGPQTVGTLARTD